MAMRIEMYVVGDIGTNCYLVWDEESGESMLIDPGAYEPAVTHTISENGLLLDYIVLTHGHFDHILGVNEFKAEYPEIIIAAGINENGLLGSPDANGSKGMGGKDTALVPEIMLKEGDALRLGELSFQVMETPGHTPGGLCFYVAECDTELTGQEFSGTVFSGDTLFHMSVGRTDFPGGDINVLRASILDKLFTLPDDTLVLPGHMDATTIGYEMRWNPFTK